MTMLNQPPQHRDTRLDSPRRRSSRKWWLIGGLVVLGAVLYAFAHHTGSDAGQQAQKGQGPVLVATGPVTRQDVPRMIHTIGNVDAFSTVSVRAEVNGQLTGVYFRQGDMVHRGQLLFKIDPRPYQAALDQARATLARDQANAALAVAEQSRYAGLAKQGFVSREQAEQYRASAQADLATVQADKASVETARVNMAYTTITSPIDGVAGILQVNQGNLVSANAPTALVTINQIHPIYVSFSLDQAQVPDVQRAQSRHPIQLVGRPKNGLAPTHGTLALFNNQVDPTTGTLLARGVFPNKENELVPGQFMDVDVNLGTDMGAITVPAQAIQTGQNGPYCFVVKPDNTVELRNVAVSRTEGAVTVVTKGLQPGETVVTDGQLNLKPGSQVKVTRTESAPTAPSEAQSTTKNTQAPAPRQGRRGGGPGVNAGTGGQPAGTGANGGQTAPGTAGQGGATGNGPAGNTPAGNPPAGNAAPGGAAGNGTAGGTGASGAAAGAGAAGGTGTGAGTGAGGR